MAKIAMILRKPPYGDINAAEAVRHALGAVSGDLGTVLILLDGGVHLARKDQDETGTGFTNLGAVLKDCCDMGVEVIAEQLSLITEGLKAENVIEGVSIRSEQEIAVIVRNADTTMIF
jgi:sulfur relay (sulfurtransferase) DsrF/TusC family protein